MAILYYLLLLGIAILPVVLLMVFIYRQDKYQKEPVKSLIKAFIGGMIAIPLDIIIVTMLDLALGETFLAQTVFFSAFMEAGIPEELCKFIIFMIFIWRDKNFDEYFDGIVYACFIGLGFACLENIMYVFDATIVSLAGGFVTSFFRALLSVPGHFLFGAILGYFLSMAKFRPEKKGKYIWTGLLLAMLAHGLFDWLLMVTDRLGTGLTILVYGLFILGDIGLWFCAIGLIRRQQENSRLQQAEIESVNTDNEFN
jgi:RsiW-degrading membrane proteinase PrsW (M82 family)